jgi:hypothetical protein
MFWNIARPTKWCTSVVSATPQDTSWSSLATDHVLTIAKVELKVSFEICQVVRDALLGVPYLNLQA